MSFGFFTEGEYSAEETVEVFCIPLTSSEPLRVSRVQGVLLFEVLLRDCNQGGDVVRVWIRIEDRCVGAALRGNTSPQLRIVELFEDGLLSTDVIIL